jgi:hypothetical protein
VPKDEIALEAHYRSEVNVELPEKIPMQAHNQSEGKLEPNSGLHKCSTVGFYNFHLLLVLSASQLCL